MDVALFGPGDRVIYQKQRKQYDSVDFTTTESGEHYFGFSNEFASFTHKVVYFDVAYKAETNFVDVVPQAKRLRLSLNLQFHELHDPHNFAKDVTNLGRWGNGDVEVGLSKQEELPYVMGLVRQAYEKQMDDGVGRE